jgi:hypothetical protein
LFEHDLFGKPTFPHRARVAPPFTLNGGKRQERLSDCG